MNCRHFRIFNERIHVSKRIAKEFAECFVVGMLKPGA